MTADDALNKLMAIKLSPATQGDALAQILTHLVHAVDKLERTSRDGAADKPKPATPMWKVCGRPSEAARARMAPEQNANYLVMQVEAANPYEAARIAAPDFSLLMTVEKGPI